MKLVFDRRNVLLLAAASFLAGALLPQRSLAAAANRTPMLDEDAKARLLAQARARGELPVIVGFSVPDLSAGGEAAADPSDPAEAARRQAAFARVRTRLLAELGVRADRRGVLSGPGVHTVKMFETIPFLALTAEPNALARLLASPLVTSVQADALVPPL